MHIKVVVDPFCSILSLSLIRLAPSKVSSYHRTPSGRASNRSSKNIPWRRHCWMLLLVPQQKILKMNHQQRDCLVQVYQPIPHLRYKIDAFRLSWYC